MMSALTIILFLHVAAALTFAAGLGVEWAVLPRLGSLRTIREAREWMNVLAPLQWVNMPALVTLLITGVTMALATWGWQPWMVTALVGLVLIGPLGGVRAGLHIRALIGSVPPGDGPISDDFRARLQDRSAFGWMYFRTTMLAGIAFLMTTKPAWVVSIVSLLVAGSAGVFAWQWSTTRRRPSLSPPR